MTETGQSPLHREEVEIALWQTPFPEPDAGTMYGLSQFDSKSQDQSVGNVAVGDGSTLPDLGEALSSFGSWENVASTILSRLAAFNRFDSATADFDPLAWSNFLRKFATNPFCLTYTSDKKEKCISELSLKEAVEGAEEVTKSFITKAKFDDVMTSIKKMATSAVQNEEEEEEQQEKVSNLQLGLLSRRAGKLYLGVVRTAVEMQYKKGKGYEQSEQTLTIHGGHGVLDFDKCKRSSDTLRKWSFQDVNTWMENTNSYSMSPNDSPAWKS